MSAMRLSPAEHRRLRRRARLRRELTGWAFLAPLFFCFVVFLVLPVVGTIWWSTRSGGLLGPTTSVGLQNYTQFPQMVDATSAVKNTLWFAVMSVPLTLVLALAASHWSARSRAVTRRPRSIGSSSTSRFSSRESWSRR